MEKISLRRLADIDGEVADALQVGVDLERRDDRSQIDRDRLIQRDEREASLVDFDLKVVDARIAANHVSQRLVVSFDEAPHRRAQALFCQPAHCQQVRLQLVELLCEMAAILAHRFRLWYLLVHRRRELTQSP